MGKDFFKSYLFLFWLFCSRVPFTHKEPLILYMGIVFIVIPSRKEGKKQFGVKNAKWRGYMLDEKEDQDLLIQ